MSSPDHDYAVENLLLLENQVCFALVTAARNIVAVYRPILEPLALTHPQYLVMLALWQDSPRSLGNLASALAMEAATLSPLVKRLEAQKLITRTRRPEDERVLDIGLTAEGIKLREKASLIPMQVMQQLNMELSDLVSIRDSLAPFLPDPLAK